MNTKKMLSIHVDSVTRSIDRDPRLKKSAPAGRFPGLGYIVTAAVVAGLLCLTQTGCDREVSRKYHTDRAYVIKSTQQCNTGPGYCCEYGYTLTNGKYEFSCGLKASCTGSQPVTLKVTPFTIHYEKADPYDGEYSTELSVDGACTQ
jgi:hypothetical protein